MWVPNTTTASSLPWKSNPTLLINSLKSIKSNNNIYPSASMCHSNNKHKGIGNQLPPSHFLCHFHPISTLSLPLSLKCSLNQGAAGENLPPHQQSQSHRSKGFWGKWKANSAELSSKLAKLGLAAVLAYGLFDAITYTTFFVLAFFGYEKSTGKNPAANLQALLGIVILMWTGNNITRPFRVAGAAALAPFIDKGLKKIQNYFNFPNLFYAFTLIVSIVGACCLTVVGLLILSRWGR